MKRLDPSSFRGPRAFFTAFDHRIVERSMSIDTLQRDCERKLKLLLLLKSHVVCSATHLKSDVAWRIFSAHPALLTDRHVIPALQAIKPNIQDAFKAPLNMMQFYSEHVPAVVDWELISNSSWFKDRFIEALRDPSSLLRLQAPSISDAMVGDFVERHADKPTLGRDAVQRWALALPASQRSVVLAFRELLYHISGARVVNCEGALPQEDYVDYDMADLSQRRTRLSEDMIFMKIYIELVRDEMCQRPIPVEIIDLLEWEDIITLREPLKDSGFCDRYDALVRESIALVRGDSQVDAESLTRLDAIRAHLSDTFRGIIQEDVGRFAARRRLGGGDVVSSGASVALGLAGLIPGVGPLASAISLGKDAVSFFFNLTRFSRQPRMLHEIVDARASAIGEMARRGIASDAAMIDAVRMLVDSISNRLSR